MIYFLYGEDTYRAKRKLREIINGYRKANKSGFNLARFDFSEDLAGNFLASFKDSFRQTSIFKEKKLVILLNVFRNAGFEDFFMKNKKEFLSSADLIVIFEDGKIEKKDAFFKFLAEFAKTQEFAPLAGQKLKNWIVKELGSYSVKIDPVALNVLIGYAGNDLWRISNEMAKLANYKSGGIISESDVKLMVRARVETDIFKTIDAISANDKKTALNLLHGHIEKGDSPLYLLTMIGYQFKNLLIIKDLIEKRNPYDLIVHKSGLHPYVVKKNYYAAQKFSFSELKKIYQKIFLIDVDVKTGKKEAGLALDLLIAEI